MENCLKIFNFLFYLRRRITCRKGEVQGRQRRARHDIERIVGLLGNEINLFWWWWWRQLQEAFFYMFFLFCLLYLYYLYVNLYVRSSGSSTIVAFFLLLPFFTIAKKYNRFLLLDCAH
jgi:hypothetical protein